jgi:integrase
MMAPALLSSSADSSRRHASEGDYAEFLRARSTLYTVDQMLKRRRRFVRLYPDLEAWFAVPLAERVGRRYGEDDRHPSFPVACDARPYLTFLAVRGHAWFDWPWLLASPSLYLWCFLEGAPLTRALEDLTAQACQLGYSRKAARRGLHWTLTRLFLHTPSLEITRIDSSAIDELDAAICAFALRSDVAQFYGSQERYRLLRRHYRSYLQVLRVVLYHRGQIVTEPGRLRPIPSEPAVPQPRMEAIIQRYLGTRRVSSRPKTVQRFSLSLRTFAAWLTGAYPAMASFAELERAQVLAYIQALEQLVSPKSKRSLSTRTRHGYLETLGTFLRDVVTWGWDDVPSRPLLSARDLPKRVQRVPRYIPEPDLSRLMEAIRSLECPYQRAALLIARWSGARRDEIRRLEVDCLDTYPDGTPRLRIPAGKTYQERLVPVHDEAAAAIRILQRHRDGEPTRGFADELTGRLSRRLFVHHGKMFSAHYLFETALWDACERAGLVTADGKATITAHRLRHTVGMQLAERGARLNTIMKILGHASAGMTMVYAQVTDQAVLRDYQAVLGPGAIIAGPCAETIHAGDLSSEAVDWLKTNFFKTELELGHCLRLPQEGPCECDLYLTCAKFVTTKDYAPRLRNRRQRELDLVADAISRGWEREVQRHRSTVHRIEELLGQLGEPLTDP